MEVYSRWGTLIYSTEDVNEPWDGMMQNGKQAMMGTYVYKIELELPLVPDKPVYTGYLQLIR